MRNKRETDISRYTEKSGEGAMSAGKSEGGAKRFFKGFGKFLLTAFSVVFVAMIIAGISLSVYIFTLASEPTGIDLKAKSLNQTSFIYVKDSKTGEFKESQTLYSTENRIWVGLGDIPESMQDAIVSIEDRRFEDHHGVDWIRTLSAVASLATGEGSYGGSTLTQQLVKNITSDNEVSINRKLREICKALKLEKEYTKDQILEAYLNVVNFGNNCQGVEAAAQLYFDKSIKDCSIAECAAIAGITQNPSLWNPLVYPDNNRERREIILNEMYDQEKISKAEFDQAMEESKSMTFVGFQNNGDDEDDDEDEHVQDWYTNQLFYDLTNDLAQYYNIGIDAAETKLYTEGLKIYSAVDEDMQQFIENAALNIDKSNDPDLEMGSVMMDFDGRVIATVGSSKRKTQALSWDRATHSTLQPGSSIKPVIVYPYAIENKFIYYSSFVKDEPIPNYGYKNGVLVAGPPNHYPGYRGNILLPDAIEISSNATVVQTMQLMGGPSVAYEQAVTKMGFSRLSEEDAVNMGALSIGGMNGGVSVREMAAAYTYMGNGGLYYKPYTYYYVTDSEDNIIIDNRENVPKQAYSPETASIMNRLLHYNVTNSVSTQAHNARIEGWDIIGKTGTTDDNYDSWFCGLSPYGTMATWCGFDKPSSISWSGQSVAAKFFATCMGHYLSDKENKEYKLSPNLIEATYNPATGLIVSTDYVSGKYVGYYTEDNMPAFGSPYVPNYESSGSGDGGDGDEPNYSDDPSIDPSVPEDPNVTTPEQGDDPEGGNEGSDPEGGGDNPNPDEGGDTPPEGGGDTPAVE